MTAPTRLPALLSSCAALTLLLVACGNHSATAPKPETSPQGEAQSAPAAQPEETAKPEAPVTQVQFIDGPALSPTADLRRWLSEHKDTLIRLPLAIEMSGFDVGPAWISMNNNDAGADAIHVSLDQGALSVGLLERLTPLCTAPTRCVAWLQGYWKPTVAGGPSLDGLELPGPKKAPFSVREVVGLVGEGDTATVKVVAPKS